MAAVPPIKSVSAIVAITMVLSIFNRMIDRLFLVTDLWQIKQGRGALVPRFEVETMKHFDMRVSLAFYIAAISLGAGALR